MNNSQTITNQSIDELISEMAEDFEAKPVIAEIATEDSPKIENKEEEIPVDLKKGEVKDFFSELDERFFKTNKLIPFNNEDGSDYIRPQTMEELEEVIEANKAEIVKNARYSQKEEVLEDIFKETTSAFQFLAKNANRFSSIEEMFPLAQSVQIQEDLSQLDLEDEESAEFIVRQTMELQGYTKEGIEEEIKDLKERNKLSAKAITSLPYLEKIEADKTEKYLRDQEIKNQESNAFWNTYYSSLNEKLIQAKDLDGMSLTQEDKIKVANNLIPGEEGEDLPIYSKIADLVSKNDTVTLSIISMLLEDKKLFDSYYSNKSHSEAGKSAARTLRSTVVSTPSQEDVKETVQRTNQGKSLEKSYGVYL